MMRVPGYLIAQLKRPTAWRGLVLLLTGLGANFSIEQSEAIVSAGIAIAGLIELAGLFAPADPPAR